MQVTELESKGLKRKFKVVVAAARINEQTEAELKAAGESVKIPGFRPGFIPMKVLQQRYGKAVQGDVLKQVINQTTADAITERKLRPALSPQINIEDYKEGGDLSYTIDFEIFPEVEEPAFDKLKLTRHVVEIQEKDIEDALSRIAERSPELKEEKAGAKAAEGSVVSIDFKGMLNGEAFEGGSANDFKLELGSGQFIPGFEEQLIGCKAGDDKIVTVTFPKEYPSEKLAGKEASFAVKVKGVFTKEIPVIDDDFAKARGLADARALREAVRSQLIREYDSVIRNELKKQLFDALEAECTFELPQSMLDLEFGNIWERVKEAKEQGDEALKGKSEDELKKEYEAIARRRVKLGILLAEVGRRNNLQITREELSRALMQQASQFPGQEKQVMDFYRKNPERMEDFRGPILEEKAVDFVLGKVAYDDKTVSADELIALGEEEGAVKKKTEKAKAKSPAKKKKAE